MRCVHDMGRSLFERSGDLTRNLAVRLAACRSRLGQLENHMREKKMYYLGTSSVERLQESEHR